ncbi:MAG: hypothetical protein WAM26_17850 [Nitrososphaeraceae archaeon]
MAIMNGDTKQVVHRKQCFMRGRISTCPLRMKEPWAFVSSILWQEYGGMVICAKCFVGTRAGLVRRENVMMNNPSSNPNEKKCEYCESDKTYTAVTKGQTPYSKWNNNPFKEGSWICGRCYRHPLYRKDLPPIHVYSQISP